MPMPSSCIGEALVRLRRRERPAGQQVVLVGGVHEAAAEHGGEDVLPVLDAVDDGGGLVDGVGPHRRLGVVAAHAEGHDGDRRQLRVAVEDARHRVVEHRAVVDAGAHHDLPVHLDAPVEQRPQPAQARCPPAVAQHGRPHLGVGGVDRHVQRRQALGHDPLEVGLGEPGQRREVPVEERQAVVVVPLVEAAPQALGQLVDEAEGAVVVAGLQGVEQRRVDLDAERLAGGLGHVDG